jgi:hypothetical protein
VYIALILQDLVVKILVADLKLLRNNTSSFLETEVYHLYEPGDLPIFKSKA